MLHRSLTLALPAFLAPWIGVSEAARPEASLLRDVLTVKEQEAVRRQAAAVTVTVRRRRPVTPGIFVPGGVPFFGNGWVVAPGRVVTASVLVEGWPAATDDALEVRGPDGQWRAAAPGLADARLGLAVLDVPGLTAVVTGAAPGTDAVFPGRSLYGVVEPGAPMWRFVVGARAQGMHAYYWWLFGVAPPGTPLVDVDGRVVSLVGLRAGEDPTRALLLPTSALRDLFDRSVTWLP